MHEEPQAVRHEDPVEQAMAGLLAEPDPLLRYEALTRAQCVYDAVSKRIAFERARAVAEMHGAGLSYARIADAIDLTRARAQQLVERAGLGKTATTPEKGRRTVTSQEQLTAFLEAYLQERGWPREPDQTMPGYRHWARPVPQLMAQSYTPQTLADELLANAEFRVMQLGAWLRSPDGQLITAAVEALSPPPYRQDIELLVNAITLAADALQKQRRDNAKVIGAAVAVGGILIAASRG